MKNELSSNMESKSTPEGSPRIRLPFLKKILSLFGFYRSKKSFGYYRKETNKDGSVVETKIIYKSED